MLELFPEGFEEVDRAHGVELAAYTDSAGEERVWHVFSGVRASDIADGWEDRWRAFHRPVVVGRLWVGPPWERPRPDLLAVVVDPGRAFGTGAHPTTQLCLEHLQELEPGALLDVGCGSGVLAIAASLLGHDPVTGADVDAAAIDATRANAAASGAGVRTLLVEPDELLPPTATVIANISLAAVETLPDRIDCETLVTSGYLEADEPRLDGYRRVARRTRNGWAADVHLHV